MSNFVRLTIRSSQGQTVKEIAWDKLYSFQIGRGDGADLFLNDASVSRQHCRLVAREDRLYVEDLDSRRGTLVNGQPGTFEYVDPGAELQLGEVRVRVDFDSSVPLPLEEAAPAPSSASPGRAQAGRGHDRGTGEPPLEGIDEGNLPQPSQDEDLATLVRPGSGAIRRSRESVVIELDREAVTVGRDRSHCDLRLNDLNVSRRHARLSREGGTVSVEDLGSTNGTYVNGRSIGRPTKLAVGDNVGIGAFHFVFDGRALVSSTPDAGFTISAVDLAVRNSRPSPGAPAFILKSVTLTARGGEFVGLLGTSGAGKSTLLRAISAHSRTRDGQVIYDGEDLYARFESYRSGIGYAPQKDIFHESLTLADALRFSSRLRLAKDASDEEINANIDRVLKLVELTERREVVIKHLSGGQKRRVSIAMELLSNPRVLFLDEVTSGLDPYLEKQMMKLFRRLADEQGITIFIITHHANSAELCDKVIYLNKGLLTFFGTPSETKSFFGAKTFEDIYEREGQKAPAAWRAAFERTGEYARYIASDTYHQAGGRRKGSSRPGAAPFPVWSDLWRQCRILTKRNIQVFSADRMNMLVLALGPVVALLLSLLTQSDAVTDPVSYAAKQFKLCVGATLIMFFLGIFGSVREIVKELEIYHHEHFTSVEIVPYLLSKILPLSVIGLVQSFAVMLIVINFGGAELKGSGLSFGVVLFLTFFTASLLGLAISAGVPTSDLAIMVMLFFVIPQVLFGGGLSGPKGPVGSAAFIARTFITDYWSLEAAKSLVADYRGASAAQLLPSKGFGSSLLMLGFHAVAYAAAALVFMCGKEGTEAGPALRRVVRMIRV